MGWGIDFKADIFLSKIEFTGLYTVDTAIEEAKEDIRRNEEWLAMAVSSTPKDVYSATEAELLLTLLQSEVNLAIEDLKEAVIRLYNLELYKEYLINNPHGNF